ncbi:hypothetical protein pb186bvf_012621 [Paramecium bursaria]
MRKRLQLSVPKPKSRRAVSYQKDYIEDDSLPAIQQRQSKPISVEKTKKQLELNRMNRHINLNIKLDSTSKKDNISEIDLSFKSNKLSLKVYMQKDPNKPKTRDGQDSYRAHTPPRKSRLAKPESQQFELRSESFATLETQVQNQHSLDSNISDFLKLNEKLNNIINSLKKVSFQIKLRKEQQFRSHRDDQPDFSHIEIILSNHQKLVRQAIVLIRVGIIVIVNSFFDLHFYLSNIQTFKSVLQYNYQNYLNLCELIYEQRKQSDDNTIALQIFQTITLTNKKSVNLWTTIKQNIEMLIGLYKQLTKSNRDLYQFLLTFLRTTYSIPISDSTRAMQTFISFFFTVQQSYQGLLGIPLICVAPQPYLPPHNPKGYTLVLDMDETLIHFNDNQQGGHFLVRPNTITFLQEMSLYYELVVFTAGLPDYANWVLDSIDKGNFIQYRLFRQHALQHTNMFIKDLSRLGRDLSKIIIVDNVADNFQNQPENGIFIKAWYNDPHDTELLDLSPMLRNIVVSKAEDVRLHLKAIKQNQFQLPHI